MPITPIMSVQAALLPREVALGFREDGDEVELDQPSQKLMDGILILESLLQSLSSCEFRNFNQLREAISQTKGVDTWSEGNGSYLAIYPNGDFCNVTVNQRASLEMVITKQRNKFSFSILESWDHVAAKKEIGSLSEVISFVLSKIPGMKKGLIDNAYYAKALAKEEDFLKADNCNAA